MLRRRDLAILGIASVVLVAELGVWLARPAQLVEIPPALPIATVRPLEAPVPMPTAQLPINKLA